MNQRGYSYNTKTIKNLMYRFFLFNGIKQLIYITTFFPPMMYMPPFCMLLTRLPSMV